MLHLKLSFLILLLTFSLVVVSAPPPLPTTGRNMYVPPFSMDTMSGGRMPHSSTPYPPACATPPCEYKVLGCITADVPTKRRQVGDDINDYISGVTHSYQSFRFMLQNASDQIQTVEVLYNIEVRGKYSYEDVPIPQGQIAPVTTGPTKSTITLGPYDSGQINITAICTAPTSGTPGCSILDSSSAGEKASPPHALPFPPPTATSCPSDQQRICIGVTSRVQYLAIHVVEDKGAVLAYLHAWAHRVCGFKDHFLSSPPQIAVNGGRPF